MKVGSGNGMFPGGVVLATAWKRKALLPGAAQEYRDHVVMLFTPHGRFGEAAILRKVLRLAQEWHITDRAPRTVKEYQETVEYIYLNPLRRALPATRSPPRTCRACRLSEFTGIVTWNP